MSPVLGYTSHIAPSKCMNRLGRIVLICNWAPVKEGVWKNPTSRKKTPLRLSAASTSTQQQPTNHPYKNMQQLVLEASSTAELSCKLTAAEPHPLIKSNLFWACSMKNLRSLHFVFGAEACSLEGNWLAGVSLIARSGVPYSSAG